MATIDSAKTTVRAYVKANGAQEITGDVLQGVLIDMLDAVDDVKVDKEEGKGLSTNDFTDAYQAQVDTNTSDIASLSSEVSTLSSEVAEMTVEVEAATALATAAAETANEAAATATTAASSASSAASSAEDAASTAEGAAQEANEAAENADSAVNTLTSQVESAISTMENTVSSAVSSMESTVSTAVSSMESTVSSAVSSMESEVSEAVEQAQSDVATAVSDAESATESATEAASEASAAAASIDNGYIQGLVSGSILGSLGGGVSESFTSEVLSGIGKGGASLKAVRGKSMVWNQLDRDLMQDWGSNMQKTTSDNVATFTSVASSDNAIVRQAIGAGHKVYVSLVYKSNKIVSLQNLSLSLPANEQFEKKSAIYTPTSAGIYLYNYSQLAAGEWVIQIKNFMFIDLTLMFGAGNEPSSVADFEALYNRPYYAYNQGEVKSNLATGLQSVGRNIWDEQWELGSISISSGADSSSTSAFRSVNYIPVLPSTTYYYRKSSSSGGFYLYEYDADYNFLGYTDGNGLGGELTTSASTAYLRIRVNLAYYQHDICINVSDTTFNGNYVPYWSNTLSLPLGTMTGKLNGSGDSVVVNADGFHGVGDYADLAIIKNGWWVGEIKGMTKVDLGDLTWLYYPNSATGATFRCTLPSSALAVKTNNEVSFICAKYLAVAATPMYSTLSGADKVVFIEDGNAIKINDSAYTDAATFKTAMSGVYLYYELATPLVYTLDEPFLVQFPCENGGTISRLPLDTESSVLAPFDADICYPQVLINGTSDTNLLEALKTAGIISSYTRTWDEDSNAYQYTLSV